MSDSSYDSSLRFGASDGSDSSSESPVLPSIVRGAFKEIHGFSPKDWQIEVANDSSYDSPLQSGTSDDEPAPTAGVSLPSIH
jgi:hypothetical protein